MSLQLRRDRREGGSRFPPQRAPRQEWVPKGTGASTTTAPTTSTTAPTTTATAATAVV
ncbi:hypothetical protein A2U01_0050218, partial [Trifolium medium]|nr:hypothetical protein [Trifolium medium]